MMKSDWRDVSPKTRLTQMLDVKPAMETDLTLNEAEDKLKQMRAEAGLTHVQCLEKPLVDRGWISPNNQ